MRKTYHRGNFYKKTFCLFREVEKLNLPFEQSNHRSFTGSEYYFTEEGVYRRSNHWGRVSHCRWRLMPLNESIVSGYRIGYANWSDFYSNNENESLFFIKVNFENHTAWYQHKDHPEYDGQAVLRPASATAKVIKEIREVFSSDAWAGYLPVPLTKELRECVIRDLVYKNARLLHLKRKLISEHKK